MKYFINDNNKTHTSTVYRAEDVGGKTMLVRLATFTLRNKTGAVREEVGKLVEELNRVVALGQVGKKAFPAGWKEGA